MWIFRPKPLRIGIKAIEMALLALSGQLAEAFSLCLDPVRDIASLSALSPLVSAWPDGVRKYVQSVRDCFCLVRSSAPIATDGITVVSAGPPLTYWVRDRVPSPVWQRQPSWFVDPGPAGDDENIGADAAHPLKTVAEWARRVGVVKVDMTLTCMADIPDTDLFPVLPVDDKGRLLVQGTLVDVESGVVAGVTAEDPAAPGGGVPLQFSKAAGDFSLHVGRLVYFEERDSYGFIAKDMAGAAHAAAILPPRSFGGQWDTSGVASPPQPGDHYHVLVATRLPARAYPSMIQIDGRARTIYSDVDIVGGGIGVGMQINSPSLTSLRRCRLAPDGGFAVLNGAIEQSVVCLGSPASAFDHACYFWPGRTYGTLALGSGPSINIQQSNQWDCLGPVMAVGLRFSIYVDSGVRLNGGNLSIFDAVGIGLRMREGACLDISSPASSVYGNGNTSFGADLPARARILHADAASLNIVGAAGELSLRASDLMPVLGPFAAGPLPAAQSCVTWIELFSPPFNGNVVNYDTLASITS